MSGSGEESQQVVLVVVEEARGRDTLFEESCLAEVAIELSASGTKCRRMKAASGVSNASPTPLPPNAFGGAVNLIGRNWIQGRSCASRYGQRGGGQQEFPLLQFFRGLAELLEIAIVENVDAHGMQRQEMNREVDALDA